MIEAWNNFKGVDPLKFRNFTEELETNGYKTQLLGKIDDVSGHHSESERVEGKVQESMTVFL